MRCLECCAPVHAATGHLLQRDPRPVWLCGRCARRWATWIAKQTARCFRVGSRREKPARWVRFYDYAEASRRTSRGGDGGGR